jgi:hypothetical protein
MRFLYSLGVGLLSAALLTPSTSLAQAAPCPPLGIKTDPAIATNPGGQPNTFNWYYGSYQAATYSGSRYALNSPYPGVGQDYLELPWRQPYNSNMDRFQGKIDMPQDGWELIRRDLGYDDAGNPAKTTNPTLILYNRRTSMLRVFTAVGDLQAGYQFAEIKLSFGKAGTYKAGTLNRQSALGVALEDTEAGTNTPFVSVARYLNSRSKWFVADFPMEYDPCVCQFDSRLSIEVNLVSSADIKLTGKTTGSLVTAANGTGSTNSDMDKGIPFIRKVNGALEAGGKSYDNIDKFTSKLSGQNPDKASALSSFAAASKDKSFLKAGLSALPYVGAAISMLDFFMGGGKDEGPQQVSMQPMTIEMSTTTTGTMTATNLYATIPFHNPGNRLTTTIPENVPYYNEAMGVISLLKRPVVDGKQSSVAYSNRDRVITNDFRLTQDLSYALNPASRLEVQDFKVALVAEGPDANSTGGGSFTNYEGKAVQPDGSFRNLYRTDYFDAACVKNQLFSWIYVFNPVTGYHSEEGQIENVYLKVMVNLRPLDNPAAQNVLFVARYPVTRQAVSTFSALPTATCGVLPEATPSAIAAVCSSSKYQQSMTLQRLAAGSPTTAASVASAPTAQLLASPNPASGSVRLSSYIAQTGQVKLTLHDNLGRIVRNILDSEAFAAGELDVHVALDGLAPGIYHATLQTASQRLVTKIVVTN